MSSVRSQWFLCRKPRSRVKTRLLAFPHAGGTATIFHGWPDLLPEELEVHAVRLPGRETRLYEPAFRNLRELVAALVPAVLQLADRPLALFGFSVGALVAFELARCLEQTHGTRVAHLFLAARPAPDMHGGEQLHQLPDADFLRRLEERYGELPAVIRKEPKLLELFLPVIRADMAISETYAYYEAALLECPLTVYGGTEDSSTSFAQLSQWKNQTRGQFDVQLLPGDHFFPLSSREELLRDIARRI